MSVRHRTQFDIAQTRPATRPSVTLMTTEQTATTGPTAGLAPRLLRNDPTLFISDLLPLHHMTGALLPPTCAFLHIGAVHMFTSQGARLAGLLLLSMLSGAASSVLDFACRDTAGV